MLSCFLAVDEDLGPLIDTLEMESDNLTLGGSELLAILALATLEPATASACSTSRRVGCIVDIPVVWKIYCDGFPVTGKLPAAVEELLR